ncbi:MAG TPA: hypothetical protein VEI97_08595, partial [bacterium]|nr:hypothetical protein [bacterium]
FARPSADTNNPGSYTDQGGGSSNIFGTIDETVASDADFIRSGTDPANAVYVTKLSNVTDPVSSTGHILRVRAGTDVSSGGNQIDLTAQLRQGYVSEGTLGTLIATLTQTNVTAGGFTTYSHTLSGAEADAITDYTSLYLRVLFNKP